MSVAELADVVSGTVADCGDPGATMVTAPATLDSREITPGGLFAAFAGEHVDGHDYAAAAIEAGAAVVLAQRPVGVPAVIVPDVGVALSAAATRVLQQLPGVTVLAVTGSQGKTSTKDLLAAVLADAAPTVATRGSFNNELGLPLTVLGAGRDTAYLLLEMGARGPGHIKELCEIAPPDVSLVLNVGKAHLGEFGSQEGIARAKGELVEALAPEGTAVLNADDPWVWGMAERTRGSVLSFGSAESCDLVISDVGLDERGRAQCTLSHAGRPTPLRLQLVGEHQARNAAAAAAAALAVGIPLERACQVLSDVATLSHWRMEILERDDGLLVINDSYNANPDSMEAALRALVAVGDGRGRAARREGRPVGRLVAVLGEMRELGESSELEHETVGRLAARLGVDRVVTIGDGARGIDRGVREEMTEEGTAVFVDDTEAAARWLSDQVSARDTVLVKASRGARLDRVADALLAGPEVSR